MALSDFIPSDEQHRIVDAITQAERRTSGEICVHVTPRCRGDVYKQAVRTFNRLKLYQTQLRNAMLIFVAYESRKFAIIGDQGIDAVVPAHFWTLEKETLAQALKQGKPVDGLCTVIGQLGDTLAKFFPADRNDVNELSNEITYED